MKSTATRSSLKRRADQLFSRRIRERDGSCRACGSAGPLQCAHIVSRRYHSTRWSDDNAVALCASCHVRYTHNPLLWEQWVLGRIGSTAFWELRRRALEPWDRDIATVLERLAA